VQVAAAVEDAVEVVVEAEEEDAEEDVEDEAEDVIHRKQHPQQVHQTTTTRSSITTIMTTHRSSLAQIIIITTMSKYNRIAVAAVEEGADVVQEDVAVLLVEQVDGVEEEGVEDEVLGKHTADPIVLLHAQQKRTKKSLKSMKSSSRQRKRLMGLLQRTELSRIRTVLKWRRRSKLVPLLKLQKTLLPNRN
jgi:hypothetical protein